MKTLRLIWLAVMMALVGCGDAGGPSASLVPARFTLIGGADQVDTVVRELKDMIALRIIASDGVTPVPNYPITWTALDGGSVFASVVNSGIDGVARQRWTLGPPARKQRLVARALNPETGAVLVDDTVTATAIPGWASAFRATFGPHAPANLLTVGDTGIIAYWYKDAWGNDGAMCADGGPPQRITWTSADPAAVEPLGTLISLAPYAAWYAQRGMPVPPYATQVLAKAVRTNGVDVMGFGHVCAPGASGAGVSFLVR